MSAAEYIKNKYGKNPADCTDREVYEALLAMTQELARQKETGQGKKKLYYISAEFLMGKLLSSNLINLGPYR